MDTFAADMRLIYWRQSRAIIFVNEKFSRTNAGVERLYLQHAMNVVAEQGILKAINHWIRDHDFNTAQLPKVNTDRTI